MTWLENWLRANLPIEIMPGWKLVLWIEVRGPEGNLFTVETLRLVCTWFGSP